MKITEKELVRLGFALDQWEDSMYGKDNAMDTVFKEYKLTMQEGLSLTITYVINKASKKLHAMDSSIDIAHDYVEMNITDTAELYTTIEAAKILFKHAKKS